jgi:hypothetical protein
VRTHRLALLAAVSTAALLAGCGGGRSPDSLQGADVTPPAATTPETTATAPPAKSDAENAGTLGARLERRVALRTAPDGKIIAALDTKTRWGSPRVLAVVEQRNGWLGVLTEHEPGKVGWIPGDAAELLLEPWSLHIDLSARRVAVSHEGKVVRVPRVVVTRDRRLQGGRAVGFVHPAGTSSVERSSSGLRRSCIERRRSSSPASER